MKYYVNIFSLDVGIMEFQRTVAVTEHTDNLKVTISDLLDELGPGEEIHIGAGEGDEEYFPPD